MLQRSTLRCLEGISRELQLLNARFESTFETAIEATDL